MTVVPKQFVYVIEKEDSKVKVGFSQTPELRIKTLQRSGGFRITNYKIFGPFQNGCEVETRIHHKLAEQRLIGEWFDISFDEAVSVAENIADEFGDKNTREKEETDIWHVFSTICPASTEIVSIMDKIKEMGFWFIFDETGKPMLESENGIMSLELFFAITQNSSKLTYPENLCEST